MHETTTGNVSFNLYGTGTDNVDPDAEPEPELFAVAEPDT